MQLLKNRIGGGSPSKRLALGVVVRDELVDALHELLDAGERTTADGLVGDQREEALDLVQPGTVGRNEMHVPTRPARQPSLDLRVTVGSVVVHDAVHVQLSRHSLVDLAQERQELLVPVAWFAAGQHRPVEHVQRRKQRCGAVALVVMGDPFDIASCAVGYNLRWLMLAVVRLGLTGFLFALLLMRWMTSLASRYVVYEPQTTHAKMVQA